MASHLLRLDAPAHELVTLRQLLLRMVDEAPEVLAAIAPNAPPTRVVIHPEISTVLRAFGLLSGARDALVTLPLRRQGDHFYVMAVGGSNEYLQDVWPETDALLAKLDGAPPGRVLDMGTGCGIVAIEAVARGHTVVATDLYADTLALAAFNARLNGITERLEFRQGHLFEPVAGETFDLVLTAPHYTRVADQLRLEAIRAAAPLSTPTGRVVIATFCEWGQGEDLAMTRSVLAEHARNGFDVAISPMPQALKQEWFTVATTDDVIAGLPSRHRFLVEITRATGTGTVTVTRPTEDAVTQLRYAHLRHLTVKEVWPSRPRTVRRLPMIAVVEAAADLAQLDELITAVRSGLVTLDGEIPIGLLDSCRFGSRPCVPTDVTVGSVGAILDRNGNVRPCAHGEPVATWTTTYEELKTIYHSRARSTSERRGCATCSAQSVCSRCLFPHVVDEDTYCTAIRRWAASLADLQRLLGVLITLEEPTPPLRIKLRPTPALIAAKSRPTKAVEQAPADLEQAIGKLAAAWGETSTALSIDGEGRLSLFWWEGAKIRGFPVHPMVAAIGELVGEGVTASELLGYLRGVRFPLDHLPQIFDVFTGFYGPPQN